MNEDSRFLDGHGALLLAMTKPYLKPFLFVMASPRRGRDHPGKSWPLESYVEKLNGFSYTNRVALKLVG